MKLANIALILGLLGACGPGPHRSSAAPAPSDGTPSSGDGTPAAAPATPTISGAPCGAGDLNPTGSGAPTTSPSGSGATTASPSGSGAPTTSPSGSGAPTTSPSGSGAPTTSPSGSGAPTTSPSGSGVPCTPPSSSGASFVHSLRGDTDFMIGLDNQGGSGWEQQGIKLDIFYAYLCCGYGDAGWAGWNPNGTYVDLIAAEADKSGATPMFTYYQLALELENGDDAVLTSENLHQYLKDVKLMYERLAVFGKPAIVHFEPDFFGYLRKHTVANHTTPAQVAATIHYSDVPDCAAFDDTVTGLLACLVDMGRKTAPLVKIGFSSSSWGDWYDPTDASVDVAHFGTITGDFLASVGALKTDYVVVETADRDAGYYETIGQNLPQYWDPTNQTLPNFHQHFTWVKALTDRLGIPALWWQTPLGVPGTAPGTAGHYRDDRVQYFFSHVGELAACGSVGMAFGAGPNQTTIQTDGGQFKAAAAAYVASPFDLAKP